MNDRDFETNSSPIYSKSKLFCVFVADPRYQRDRLVSWHESREEALSEERRLNREAMQKYGDPFTHRDVPLYYCCPADCGIYSRCKQQREALQQAAKEGETARVS